MEIMLQMFGTVEAGPAGAIKEAAANAETSRDPAVGEVDFHKLLGENMEAAEAEVKEVEAAENEPGEDAAVVLPAPEISAAVTAPQPMATTLEGILAAIAAPAETSHEIKGVGPSGETPESTSGPTFTVTAPSIDAPVSAGAGAGINNGVTSEDEPGDTVSGDADVNGDLTVEDGAKDPILDKAPVGGRASGAGGNVQAGADEVQSDPGRTITALNGSAEAADRNTARPAVESNKEGEATFSKGEAAVSAPVKAPPAEAAPTAATDVLSEVPSTEAVHAAKETRVEVKGRTAAVLSTAAFENSIGEREEDGLVTNIKAMEAVPVDGGASNGASTSGGDEQMGEIRWSPAQFSPATALKDGAQTSHAGPLAETAGGAQGTEVFEKLDNAVRLSVAANGKSVSVSLHPENLGRLDIRLTGSNGVVSAVVRVENAEVKRILEVDSAMIKDVFARSGLVLEKLGIELAGSGRNTMQGNASVDPNGANNWAGNPQRGHNYQQSSPGSHNGEAGTDKRGRGYVHKVSDSPGYGYGFAATNTARPSGVDLFI